MRKGLKPKKHNGSGNGFLRQFCPRCKTWWTVTKQVGDKRQKVTTLNGPEALNCPACKAWWIDAQAHWEEFKASGGVKGENLSVSSRQ